MDDVQCEKDTSWRRRVMKVFNKVEKDFKTLREYNDYLEEVEDISESILVVEGGLPAVALVSPFISYLNDLFFYW